MWDALRHGVTSTLTYCDADFLLAESEASETLTELERGQSLKAELKMLYR